MRVVIYPYNIKSESARAMKEMIDQAFDPLLVYPDKAYVHKPRHLVLNWGNSLHPKWLKDLPILNHPEHVAAAINKLTTLQRLKGTVQVPEFTIDPNQALEWLRNGHDAIARTKLEASEGYGAHFIEATDPVTRLDVGFPNEGRVRMWTRYVPKAREFRIHVFRGQVIHTQEKKRNLQVPDANVDWKIRSHNKGWIFAVNDIDPVPPMVFEAATRAIRALGLDFGACDIIWNDKAGSAFFLEVNTAPGLEGSTTEAYAQAINEVARRA